MNNLICNSALVVATALLTACATSTPQPQPVAGGNASPPPAAYAPPPTAVRSATAPNALVASLNDGPSNGTAQSMAAPKPRVLDKEYEMLLDALGFEPATIDTLVARTQLPGESVASMLLILELEGRVASLPGGRYGRIP